MTPLPTIADETDVWAVTPEHEAASQRLGAALAALQEAEKAVAEAIRALPVLPADLGAEATYTEGGYERWSEMTCAAAHDEEPIWQVFSNGWDDMSEGGSYAFADTSGVAWQLPEDIDWT